MKSKFILSVLILFFALTTQVNAQKAEKIYSIVQVSKPNSYYVQQMALWRKEIDANKQNADAWFNYYKANRYAIISGKADTLITNRFAKLKDIVDEMEKYIPNTFEFNFVKWSNSNGDEAMFPYLEKANALAPERVEPYSSFVSYYEAAGNTTKRDYYAKKWFETGEVSPGLLNYNYNVLVSLKPNAILITDGDNDTYPVWILQAALNIRTDVKVVNMHLLAFKKEYAKKFCNEYGITLPVPDESQEAKQKFFATAIQQIADNKKKAPVYVALTTNSKYNEAIEKNLYLIGLAYEYSLEKTDNIALLQKNMEKLYALDYLKTTFVKDDFASVVAYANTNYIVPMVALYEHYKLSDNMQQAEYWKSMIKMVAKNGGVEDQLKDFIKE